MNADLLRAALWYARHLNWRVLPLHAPVERGGRLICDCMQPDCPSPGKHPRVPGGVRAASGDPETIHGWWRRWPTANIGLATGGPSGVWVLDVDGADGEDSLAALEVEHGPLPQTAEALTGGGGRHLLFRYDPRRPLANRVRFAPGLDVRADGGYIVLAPSLHIGGRRYAWEVSSRPDQVAVAEAPAWLYAVIADAPRANARSAPAGRGYELPKIIEQGQRHDRLVSLAGTLRRRGCSEAAILACLRAENAERCRPPLSDAELEIIARSMLRYPPSLARMIARGADAKLEAVGGGGR